jgi:ribosomal protein S18 acetylase RimI-like enzyme
LSGIATSGDLAPPYGWRRAASAGLNFRIAADEDQPFLSRLYTSTRLDELAPVPWSHAQKAAFLDAQFRAQHFHYRTHYPNALWLVILHDKEPIGRLYLDRWPSEHRIIDIALLPGLRGKGYGGALMQDLIDEAIASGKAVSIHVEKNNPARHLYERLGFAVAGEQGVYDRLEWRPAAQVNTA